MTYTSILTEIGTAIEKLEQIPPMNLNPKVQWTGLVGVAQDMFYQNKFEKLSKRMILDDVDYLNVPSFLIKSAKSLETLLVNEKFGNDSNGEMSQEAVNCIVTCYNKWLSICPEIDQMTVEDNEIVKGVAIPYGVATKYYIYQSFLKFNLQENSRKEFEKDFDYIKRRIKRLTENVSKDRNSGCLSILLAVLIPTTIVCFLIL